MLEVLFVALLCSWVSKTARSKGRSGGAYIALTLGLWFGLEVLGVVIGLSIWDEFYPAYGLGLGGAVLGGIIAAVIASSAKPVAGFVAAGQMPYYQAQPGLYPPGYPPQPGVYPPQQPPYAPAAVQPPAAPAAGGVTCPGCSAPNTVDASYCYKCGTPLKG